MIMRINSFAISRKIDEIEDRLTYSEPSSDLSKKLFMQLAKLPQVPAFTDRLITLYGKCHTMEWEATTKKVERLPVDESHAITSYQMIRLLSRGMWTEFEKTLLNLDIGAKAQMAYHASSCGATLDDPSICTLSLIRALIAFAEGGPYPTEEEAQIVLDDLEKLA